MYAVTVYYNDLQVRFLLKVTLVLSLHKYCAGFFLVSYHLRNITIAYYNVWIYEKKVAALQFPLGEYIARVTDWRTIDYIEYEKYTQVWKTTYYELHSSSSHEWITFE